MRSELQQTLLVSLATVLIPVVRLLLKAGVGCSEFVAVAKAVFVQVATDEYGLRGRPTNMSRVAALTGLSRKEVRRVRAGGPVVRWTPNMESSPANTVIHYWHYDPDYFLIPGQARSLPFKGEISFSSLVRKYAGDIPPGAMKTELVRTGTISEDEEGLLLPSRRFFYPVQFNADFIRYLAFAISNLGNTLVHNAEIVKQPGTSEEVHVKMGRFERMAWTERLSPDAFDALRGWVRAEGTEFIKRADDWIGRHELPRCDWDEHPSRIAGVGVYYFEEDK